MNYNIKYLIKQLLLLETYLFKPDYKCQICIKNKFLLIESLMDGIIRSSDDSLFYYPLIFSMIDKLRTLQKKYPKLKIKDIQKIRNMRKKLMTKTFEIPYDTDIQFLKTYVNHKCANNLLPILNPMFNIREVVKNILLLEDHLLDKRRRCPQCLKKHLLLVEAFLDESITLSSDQKFVNQIANNIRTIRFLQAKLLDGRKNYFFIAMELKKIRFEHFKKAFNFVIKCCV